MTLPVKLKVLWCFCGLPTACGGVLKGATCTCRCWKSHICSTVSSRHLVYDSQKCTSLQSNHLIKIQHIRNSAFTRALNFYTWLYNSVVYQFIACVRMFSFYSSFKIKSKNQGPWSHGIKCQAESSGKLSLVDTSWQPLFGLNLLPSTKTQLKRPSQKESHCMYALEDTPLKNAIFHHYNIYGI